MNLEIKQRIEQIKKGQVPQGYKKTKVGIVPNEWEVKKLEDYLFVNKDKNENLLYDINDVFSISGEYGIVNQIKFLGRSYAGKSVKLYRIVYPNNIVYTKSPLKSNPYGIIKTNKNDKTGIVSTLYAVYKCKNNIVPEYVQLYFNLDYIINNYLLPLVNIGAKNDMKISDENVLKGKVVFPPLAEQQKIAEILSTQDKVIELKEKLIEEKQKQKKYLMQNLLTGKIRLKDFTGEWRKVELGEVCDTFSGGTPKTDNKDFYGGKISFIRSAEINLSKTALSITELGYKNSSAKMIKKGDLLYALYGANSGDCAISKQNGAINQAVLCIRSNKEFINIVYYNLLNFKNNIVSKYLQGGQGNLSANIIKKLKIKLPSLEEQKDIAEILSTQDKEIELLQKQLEEEKQKKKSLMQLLLTGIVRV